MKKIFAPLNRWNFAFYIFLVWIFNGLYTHFGMFFDLDGTLTVYIIFSELLIVSALVLKRLFDIFDKLWKSVLFTIISVLLLIAFGILSVSTLHYDLNGMQTSNRIMLSLYPIYLTVLFLFLSLKNGKVSKFLNLDWKLIPKRVALFVFIFSIFKILTLSFDTILTSVDYRMYPSLELPDRLLANKIMNITSLKRGDIVCIIENENGVSHPLRILGLPNEKIKFEVNKIYINDKIYTDEFAYYSQKLEPINFQETIELDKDSYLLIGDNRYYHKSGKIYLQAKKSDMFGKVIAVNYYGKSLDKKVLRNHIGFAFAIGSKKFGFNSSPSFENLFGKP